MLILSTNINSAVENITWTIKAGGGRKISILRQ